MFLPGGQDWHGTLMDVVVVVVMMMMMMMAMTPTAICVCRWGQAAE